MEARARIERAAPRARLAARRARRLCALGSSFVYFYLPLAYPCSLPPVQ